MTQSPSKPISLLTSTVSGSHGDLQHPCTPCVDILLQAMTLAVQCMSKYLNKTISPLVYLYKRMLSLSTSTLSLHFEPSGLNVGCMDLPCMDAGPATRSFTVIKTGVSQAVLIATLLKNCQLLLICCQGAAYTIRPSADCVGMDNAK